MPGQRAAGQGPGQIGRGHFPAHPDRLPGPKIGEIDPAELFGSRFQGTKRGGGMGKCRGIRRDRPDLAHHAVGDAARRAAGHDIGNDGGIVGGLRQRDARRRDHLGFRAAQIGGADLNAGRAQRERRRDTAPVGDAAGRNHRHLHGIHHLRHQRESAGLLGDVFSEEHAAMAARLRALRDDHVGAVLFQPDRLLHRCRRRHHDAACRLDALDQIRRRQSEMEADHLGLQLFDHGAHGLIERRTVSGVDGCCGIDAQFPVVGGEPLPSSRPRDWDRPLRACGRRNSG